MTGKLKAITIIILLCISVNLYALKPDREYQTIPSEYSIIYRDVSFETEDGITIHGWFFPAQDTSGIQNRVVGHFPVEDVYKGEARPYQTIDSTRRKTIIVCDGDGGNMSYMILYAYHLFTRGYNVLMFDWRGFGKSDEWMMDQDMLCYTEFLKDYDAAIEFVKRQPEVDSTRIGVFGMSTGAYLSFAAAANNKSISAYAGRALITSFDDVIPILKAIKPDRDLFVPDDYPVRLQPINAAKNLDIPVFLIVGENDDRTPVWMSNKVMSELKGSRELWIVKGAGHGGGEGPEYINYPEFFIRLVEFYDKYL
jgi:uncharacterized protein